MAWRFRFLVRYHLAQYLGAEEDEILILSFDLRHRMHVEKYKMERLGL
jgi:hypothetical protein